MYTIGKLARHAKVNPDSIRFYERQGLLAAATKTPSGYRLYTDAAIRRITFIKHAQRCGFSLAEISQILQADSGEPTVRSQAYRLAADKQAEIDDMVEALRTMSEALSCMLDARKNDERGPVPFEQSALMNALEPGLKPAGAKPRLKLAFGNAIPHSDAGAASIRAGTNARRGSTTSGRSRS